MIRSMVEKYSKFRWTMLICMSCMVVTIFLYAFMQPSSKEGTPYGSNIPAVVKTEETPHARGLYVSSSVIDELNEKTYQVVLRGKSPTVVLYYASWCGHCRNFVKPFNELADKTLKKVAAKNAELVSTKNRLAAKLALHFTAVDCAEYTSICSKAEVKSYPTLMAYNNGASQGKVVGATAAKALKLIEDVYLINQDDSADAAVKIESVQLPDTSLRLPSALLSYTASPKERFADALVSLDYLLSNELPYMWTEGHRTSLMEFLRIVIAHFPASSEALQSKRGVYENILEIVRKDGQGSHKFLSDKIKTAVRDSPLYRAQWMVCGVPTGTGGYIPSAGDSAPPLDAASTKIIAQRRARAANRRVRSLEGGKGAAGSSLRGAVGAVNATAMAGEGGSGGSGYTCGLWFLFHYLTVRAETAAAGGVTAQDAVTVIGAAQVADAIYHLVRDFFSCHDCREHFMAAYEGCVFERCTMTAADYNKLQMWFFHQHNAVTQSVYAAATMASNGANTEVLWPGAAYCSGCRKAGYLPAVGNATKAVGYDAGAYDVAAVTAHLKAQYLLD